MARPKKQIAKVEAPAEILSDVLSPTYTLEPKADLTVIGPDGDIPEVQVKMGLIQFVPMLDEFDSNIYDKLKPRVYMMCRISDERSLKSETCYRSEDLQDAFALGCKVDALLEYKKNADPYAFDVPATKIKEIESKMYRDFSKWHEELAKEGYVLRKNFNLNDVMVSMHSHSWMAVLFEVR